MYMYIVHHDDNNFALLYMYMYMYIYGEEQLHTYIHVSMRDEKEASKVIQTTRQSNTAHPRQSLFLRKMSYLGWDSMYMYVLVKALFQVGMHVFPCIDLTQIQRMTDANTGSVEELLKAKSNELLWEVLHKGCGAEVYKVRGAKCSIRHRDHTPPSSIVSVVYKHLL